MVQQFLRLCHATANGVTFKGGGNTDLRIRFDVRQQDSSSPNVAQVWISNCSDATAAKVMKNAEHAPLSLSAGYAGNEAVLFKGEIIQVRRGRDPEAPTDKILHVIATSGERARNTAVVSKTLEPGHTFRDRVDLRLKAMQPFGVGAGYITALPGRKFPGAFTAHGMATSVLREICFATGTSWSIQNDRFQLLKTNEAKPGRTVVLNARTGLVGQPTQTLQGVEGRCLLNPSVVPGVLVQIDQRSIQMATFATSYQGQPLNDQLPSLAADGFYRVYEANYVGDTRGEPFFTEFVGTANGQGISAALAARGISDAFDYPNEAPAAASSTAFSDPSVKAGPR